MTEEYVPCNVEANEADIQRAKLILKDGNNYIARYLRHAPTVGLARFPARNADGAVIVDAPNVRKRVICAGIPYACMIAFQYNGELRIGWSKRIDAQNFIETEELRDLFGKIIEESANFESFCVKLAKLMSCHPLKETEIPFSKVVGRQNAVIRGLKDSLRMDGKYLVSDKSGPLPGDVAKNLSWFIQSAQAIFGGPAVNVLIPAV